MHALIDALDNLLRNPTTCQTPGDKRRGENVLYRAHMFIIEAVTKLAYPCSDLEQG